MECFRCGLQMLPELSQTNADAGMIFCKCIKSRSKMWITDEFFNVDLILKTYLELSRGNLN